MQIYVAIYLKSFYYNLDNDNYSPDKKEIICKRQEIKHTKYNSKKYQIMKIKDFRSYIGGNKQKNIYLH